MPRSARRSPGGRDCRHGDRRHGRHARMSPPTCSCQMLQRWRCRRSVTPSTEFPGSAAYTRQWILAEPVWSLDCHRAGRPAQCRRWRVCRLVACATRPPRSPPFVHFNTVAASYCQWRAVCAQRATVTDEVTPYHQCCSASCRAGRRLSGLRRGHVVERRHRACSVRRRGGSSAWPPGLGHGAGRTVATPRRADRSTTRAAE